MSASIPPTVERLPLDGLVKLSSRVFPDARGMFLETWNQAAFAAIGIRAAFLQDNLSINARAGTLRGIHFQWGAAAQAKLIRCVAGAVRDVVVDLRPQSPTFGKHLVVPLCAVHADALFVPRGFGHGFITLLDNTIVAYKADAFYAPDAEGSIRWNDPDLQIDWGSEAFASTPILSAKDAGAPLWSAVRAQLLSEA